MRWAEQVACKGDRRGVYTVLVGKPEGRNHFEDPGIDERTVLKHLQEVGREGGSWTRLIWFRKDGICSM